MRRYDDIAIKFNKNGKRVLSTIIFPKIVESDKDIYIIAKSTDRLDLLSYTYYGDVQYWWIIAQANNIKGTLYLPNDTQIRIPMDLSNIISNFTGVNDGN